MERCSLCFYVTYNTRDTDVCKRLCLRKRYTQYKTLHGYFDSET